MAAVRLRDYQERAVADVLAALRRNSSVLLQLGTGGGKTVIFSRLAFLARQRGRRVMVMVHRTELIRQAVNKFSPYGLEPDIIQGRSEWYESTGCYVASVQTLARRSLPDVNLLIVDEAHHATADTYRRIIREQRERGGAVLGVTATPIRTNGAGFGDLFDELVCGPTVAELIEAGWLCPTKVYAAPLPTDALRGVRTQGGDYAVRQLADTMAKAVVKGELVSTYRQYADGKKAVLFAADVSLSRRYVEEYRSAGIPAVHVDGTTHADERERIFERFADGEIRVLSNVGIATEGVDIPDCEVVQLARPTQSLSLYLQCVGRVLRPAPGKTHAIVLDHADCTLTHGFAEMDRHWTLDGIKEEKAKRAQPPPMRLVNAQGEVLERQSAIEHRTTVELVRMTQAELAEANPVVADPRLNELSRLVTLVEAYAKRAQASGDKNWLTQAGKPKYLWAWSEFLRVFGQPRLEEIRLFRQLARFHQGWVHHTAAAYGIDAGMSEAQMQYLNNQTAAEVVV